MAAAAGAAAVASNTPFDPYSFKAFETVMLAMDPTRTKMVNRGLVIGEWAKTATSKDRRAQAVESFFDDMLLFGDPNCFQLGDEHGNPPKGAIPVHPKPPAAIAKAGPVRGGEAVLALLDKRGDYMCFPPEHPAGGVRLKFLRRDLTADASSPRINTPCLCHYHGTIAHTGDVFDSSFTRGKLAQFKPEEVINSWKNVLQLLQAGDIVRIYAPPHQAYGQHGHGNDIPPNSTLCFTIALVAVSKDDSKPGSEARKELEQIFSAAAKK